MNAIKLYFIVKYRNKYKKRRNFFSIHKIYAAKLTTKKEEEKCELT